MDFYNIKESMKRLFSVLIACVSGMLITAGCEVLGFDKEVDWALVHFVIEATDAEGNSIISADSNSPEKACRSNDYQNLIGEVLGLNDSVFPLYSNAQLVSFLIRIVR